jgi:hypothetical protein
MLLDKTQPFGFHLVFKPLANNFVGPISQDLQQRRFKTFYQSLSLSLSLFDMCARIECVQCSSLTTTMALNIFSSNKKNYKWVIILTIYLKGVQQIYLLVCIFSIR